MRKKGRLLLKVDGKDNLMPFIRRLTYTEAVGELDGMTATLKVPAADVKKVIKLVQPGKKFTVVMFSESAKDVEREGDIIAVTHSRTGQRWTIVLVGVNYLHRLRSKHVTELWTKNIKQRKPPTTPSPPGDHKSLN